MTKDNGDTAASQIGRIYIGKATGSPIIHPGEAWFDAHVDHGTVRPATEAEEAALMTIPEFAKYVASVLEMKK